MFEGDLFVPAIPNLPRGTLKFLVKSRLFSVLISDAGTVEILQAEDILIQEHPPERWASHARLMLALALGKLEIEIRPRARPNRIEFKIERIGQKLDHRAWKGWLAVCESVSDLFRLAAVPRDASLRIEDIEEEAAAVREAHALVTGRVKRISFKTGLVKIGIFNPVRAAFVTYAKAGGVKIACSAVVDFRLDDIGDSTMWTSVSITRGRARVLGGSPTDFGAFAEDAKAVVGTEIWLVHRSTDEVPAK